MADVAALVVALSAQLTRFEKDMKGAVEIADRQTKQIEDRFTKMNAEISSQLSGVAAGYSSRIGGLGSVLGTLGPIGTAVAIGLGAAVIAVNKLAEAADNYAEKQRRLKEASETTGLSLDQFKVLSRAAAAVGVDADKFESGINKMNDAINDLQKTASGPLFDALRKFPDILTELSNARDPAAAIDILARAIAGLGSEFEKSDFLKAAFGRGGFDIGRILKQVFDAGGIKAMQAAAAEAGKTVDTELVEKIVKLKIEIDKARKAQEEFVGKMVTADVLTAQKQYLDFWTEVIKLIGDAQKKMEEGQSAGGAFFRAVRNRIFGDTSGFSGITTGPTPEQAGIATRAEREAAGQFPQGAPLPTARPSVPTAGPTLEQRIRDINDMISALGGAATQTELYTQKQLTLDKQLKDGIITQQTYNRSIAELASQQAQATEALREHVGVATEDQIVSARIAKFLDDANKLGLTRIEILQGTVNLMKKAREEAENMRIKFSDLPELTRFGIEAQKTFKLFDQFGVSTLSNFENALADVAVGTTSLSEAFKKMADSIIRDLVRLTLRMSVTGPLANALSGLFGAPGAPLAGAFGQGGIGHAQHGGPVSAGKPYIVGEAGPELFVPRSSGQIVPSNVSKAGMGGGYSVVVNNYTSDTTETKQQRQQGPTGEELIISIVKKVTASGQLDGPNRSRFGLRAQKVR